MTKKPRVQGDGARPRKRPHQQGDGVPASLSPLTEALRSAIDGAGVSHYQIGCEAGVSHAVISRFMRGERDITMATADRLAVFLRLKLVKGGKGR